MKRIIYFSVSLLLVSHFGCFLCVHAETLKIGAIFSMTGKAKASNAPAILGVQLAAAELAKMQQSPEMARKFEIVYFDNKSTPIGSFLAAQKAVAQDVKLIIGASWSSHSLAIAGVAQQNKIPMISPISTIPELTRTGNYIFRICYNDDLQGRIIADFARLELHARTALIFTDIASDFSLNISDTFSRIFTRFGGKVIGSIDYKAGQSDFQYAVEQARLRPADIVFLSGHDESGFIAKKLQEARVTAIPLGTDGWSSESFFSGGGEQVREGYFIDHWSPAVSSKRSLWFLKANESRMPLMTPTALAFDAVLLAAQAAQSARTLSGADIARSIHSIKNFEGVTGTINFDEHGDAIKEACIMKIVNGSPSLLKCVDQ